MAGKEQRRSKGRRMTDGDCPKEKEITELLKVMSSQSIKIRAIAQDVEHIKEEQIRREKVLDDIEKIKSQLDTITAYFNMSKGAVSMGKKAIWFVVVSIGILATLITGFLTVFKGD